MDNKGAGSKDRRLWLRWRALAGKSRAAEPDALSLAAYAEGRLSEVEAEAVEAWLAATPEGLQDVIAAREASRRSPRFAYEHILANACDLVPGAEDEAEPSGGQILPFRPRSPQLRKALAWSSIAASLLCASLVGFSMGSNAYASLAGTQAADTTAADGLDTPGTLDNYFTEDSGT